MTGHFHRGTIVHGNTNSNSNGVKKIGHTGSSADGYGHSYMQLDGSEFLYQCFFLYVRFHNSLASFCFFSKHNFS